MVGGLQKLAWKIFTKENGITIKFDALKCIEENLSQLSLLNNEQSTCEALNFIVSTFKTQNKSKIIQKQDIEEIISTLQKNAESIQVLNSNELSTINASQYIRVVSAFEMPKIKFCSHKKTFERIEQEKGSALENSQAKAEFSVESSSSVFPSWNTDERIEMYCERYNILKERILRNENFSSNSENVHNFVLHTTTHLKGSSETEIQNIFGLLCQLREGQYFLEDPEGNVQLDLSDAMCSTGIFTENSFVIIQGCVLSTGIFKVHSIGLPPGESALQTKKHYGNIDFLPSKSAFTDDWDIIKAMEERMYDSEIVFFMDFFIDLKIVREKFFQFMDVIEEKRLKNSSSVPVAIVLAGTFIHKSNFNNEYEICPHCNDNFDSFFGVLLEKYTEIFKLTKFVVVPSSKDPFDSFLLPKTAIPIDGRYEEFNIINSSNPTRIRFFTKEIVIFRDDLMSRMQRNCIIMPNEGAFEEHMAQTILNQANLSPFPLTVRPINWNFEHSLNLTNLPDVLVILDSCDPFLVNHLGCIVANPGSFKNNDFSYLSYFPAHNKIIFNKI